jgi:transport family protein 27
MEPTQSGTRSMESKHKQLVILRCKLVIVGDACVGKTAITQVFQSGGSTYPKNYLMTVGAEFCVKQVPIPNTNTIIELYIFDCAGQSIFNQLGNVIIIINIIITIIIIIIPIRNEFKIL